MTKIEWCDITINPVVGCSKCSPGCDNCYAERFAARLSKHPNPNIRNKYKGVVDERGKWTGESSLFDISVLESLPKIPKRVFVGSMTDIFHERASLIAVAKILDKIKKCPKHTFLFLTKRPEKMREFISFFSSRFFEGGGIEKNIWLGVTVCNQEEADVKIPILLDTPAEKRFVSIEPMLGPVDLTRIDSCANENPDWYRVNAITGEHTDMCRPCPDVPKLDWVICGGETGPNSRPIHPDWVRGLRDQCASAEVPFFFKSWGEWTADYSYDDAISTDGAYIQDTPFSRIGKRRTGSLIDGREWNEFPE